MKLSRVSSPLKLRNTSYFGGEDIEIAAEELDPKTGRMSKKGRIN
jgi:hypothetical protein